MIEDSAWVPQRNNPSSPSWLGPSQQQSSAATQQCSDRFRSSRSSILANAVSSAPNASANSEKPLSSEAASYLVWPAMTQALEGLPDGRQMEVACKQAANNRVLTVPDPAATVKEALPYLRHLGAFTLSDSGCLTDTLSDAMKVGEAMSMTQTTFVCFHACHLHCKSKYILNSFVCVLLFYTGEAPLRRACR